MNLLTNLIKIYPWLNDNFVYKSCGHWVVIMKKLPETLTNETRNNIINKSYAKFRANTLHVVLIIHKLNISKTINSIHNTVYHKKIIYRVGRTINIKNFDLDLDTICSAGIHFFCSYKAAFFFEFGNLMVRNYTGKWNQWSDDGDKIIKGQYINGEKSGVWIEWSGDAQRFVKKHYAEERGLTQKMIFRPLIKWHDNNNTNPEENCLHQRNQMPRTGIPQWFCHVMGHCDE